VFATTLFGLKTFGIKGPDLKHLALSLFFLPTFDSNGSLVQPVLFVGWTLNFQVFFYGLFTCALALRSHLCEEITLILGIAGVYLADNLTHIPQIDYFSDEIMLEFLFGVAIARLRHFGRPLLNSRSPTFFGGCLIVGSCLVFGLSFLLGGAFLDHRHAIIGSAAALVVLGATGLELKGKVVTNRILLLQGAASYSILLVHPLVLQVIGKAMIVSRLNATSFGIAVGYFGTVVAVWIAGTIVHRYLEEPIHRRLRKGLDSMIERSNRTALA
jgi:exopolysaccharide production protein ExoZ